MESVRGKWADERLDDLNQRVGEGFNRVDADLRALRAEMNARFERVDSRFDALHRTLLQLGIGIVAAFAAVIATLVASVINLLAG